MEEEEEERLSLRAGAIPAGPAIPHVRTCAILLPSIYGPAPGEHRWYTYNEEEEER
jgi:hypothetical protein